MKHVPAIVAAAIFLTACGSNTNDSGITSEESTALDNAAEMLDAPVKDLIAADDLAVPAAKATGNLGQADGLSSNAGAPAR